MTPPSARAVVYMDRISPAIAGLLGEAATPLVACQIAPCPRPSPDRENSAGAGLNRAGVKISALEIALKERSCETAGAPPVISIWPLLSKTAACSKRGVVMSAVAENVPVAGL